MDEKELIFYRNRERLKKQISEQNSKEDEQEIDEIISIPSIKKTKLNEDFSSSKMEENRAGSSAISSMSINTATKENSSTPQGNISSSTSSGSLKNISSIQQASIDGGVLNINSSGGKSSGINGSVKSIKSSGSSLQTITINDFAVVKFTGADNFGKSAYTVGKKSSSRMSAAIDYITRDGVLDVNKELQEERAVNHIDYMNRESVQDYNFGDDMRSGIMYDKNGNEISTQVAKEIFSDITGERRMVYSPNPNIKMSDSDFQKVISKTMGDFGADYKKNYDYIYAIHRNTDNPHAHILMKTNDIDSNGIKMFKDELFELKMRFYENTQEIAKSKMSNMEFFYKDNSHLSLAMQIGRFTGDIPDGRFANQNIYLAENIATKYKLDFDKNAMEKDTEKLKDFFVKNNDKYQQFITNAQNRYADTFTQYSKDANELSAKYNLGIVPKDIEGFGDFLNQYQKLFLADKISMQTNTPLSKEDVLNMTRQLQKDDNGLLTQEGKDNYKKSFEWFDKNKEAVNEWNLDNKGRMSKELKNRFEHLNQKVDKPFDLPKTREDGIRLNHHYKADKMIFANDTRKATIDILDNRLDYFKELKQKNLLTKDEYKTNLERIDSLKENIKAYGSITKSALDKYNIDTKYFQIDKKIVEMDGIKLNNPIHKKALENFLSKEKTKDSVDADKLKGVKINAFKDNQVSVSALENAGIQRASLETLFKFEKIESQMDVVNFKRTEELAFIHSKSLNTWKKENMDNFEFQSKVMLADKVKDFNKIIKNHNQMKNNTYLDKFIDQTNTQIEKIAQKIESGEMITKELVEKAGMKIDDKNLKDINYEAQYISKNQQNDTFMSLLKNDSQEFKSIENLYKEDKLTVNYANSLKMSEKDLMLFEKDTRTNTMQIVKNPLQIKANNETISQKIFNSPKFFQFVSNSLNNEHGIEIKTAKDLSNNFDKVGTPSELREMFTDSLKESQNTNISLKGNKEFVNEYIDTTNAQIDKLIDRLGSGKEINIEELNKVGLDTSKIETYSVEKKADFIVNNEDNLRKLETIKDYLPEKTYNDLIEDLSNNQLKDNTLNHKLSYATDELSQLPIDLKPNFELEKREEIHEMVKIHSVKNILDEQQDNETISQKIFNSPKFFQFVSNSLNNEHGIEIKTAKDLSNNFDKVGTPSELREMFTAKANERLEQFKETNGLLDTKSFNEYQENIKAKIEASEPLTKEELQFKSLNQFINKNNNLKPLYASDLSNINLSTFEFKDYNKLTIDVEVINSSTGNNKQLLGEAFTELKSIQEAKLQEYDLNTQDKETLNDIYKNNLKKDDFIEKSEQYLKEAIDPSKAKEYFDLQTEMRKTSGFAYIATKQNDVQVPKNYFEARGVSNFEFELETVQREVPTVAMGSNENLELIKEHFKIESLHFDDYKKEFESIKDLDFSKLSVENDLDAFVKLDMIREQAILNKDVDILAETYKLEAPIALSHTIKEYGKALGIEASTINENIWIENGGSLDEFKGFGEYQVKNLPNYKEEFIEKYLNEITTEYIIQKGENILSFEDEVRISENFETLTQFIDEFKLDMQGQKEQLLYQEQITEIKENIVNGNFLRASRQMDNFEFLSEEDKLTVESFYSKAIDAFSSDEILDSIYEDIEKRMELDIKSLQFDDEDEKEIKTENNQISVNLEDIKTELEKGNTQYIENILLEQNLSNELKEDIQKELDFFKLVNSIDKASDYEEEIETIKKEDSEMIEKSKDTALQEKLIEDNQNINEDEKELDKSVEIGM